MSASRSSIRRRLTALIGATLLAVTTATAAAAPVHAADRPDPTPLDPQLEEIRAAEATELYGSPDIKPLEERDTALLTMGDSEISGEGVGNYDPDTHRDGNWCDRSYDQAIFRTGIDSDQQYNIACSGAASPHLRQETGETQWDELNQGDHLAIKARNTNLKLVWMVIGANDEGGIEFGPVATECATNRVLFQGPCWDGHTDDWAARVEVSKQGVEAAIDSVRGTMSDAGYLDDDYQLLVMNYPSPFSPDVEDNPDFPGWYAGGCLMYLEDAAFARNKAVPIFSGAIAEAAIEKNTRFLDAGRLFDGHEVCTDNTWARGLYVEVGELPSEHAFRQSFHPNARGHGAFAECVTQMYDQPDWDIASCVDPASTGSATLYEGTLEFNDIKNSDSGLCVDAEGYNSTVDTALRSTDCHGGRNQGFYYDPGLRSLHVQLSHDRCVDAGNLQEGAELTLRDCTGAATQQFIAESGKVRSSQDDALCLAFDEAEEETPLTLRPCEAAGTSFDLTARDYSDPVGYGHDDWMGSDVY